MLGRWNASKMECLEEAKRAKPAAEPDKARLEQDEILAKLADFARWAGGPFAQVAQRMAGLFRVQMLTLFWPLIL